MTRKDYIILIAEVLKDAKNPRISGLNANEQEAVAVVADMFSHRLANESHHTCGRHVHNGLEN